MYDDGGGSTLPGPGLWAIHHHYENAATTSSHTRISERSPGHKHRGRRVSTSIGIHHANTTTAQAPPLRRIHPVMSPSSMRPAAPHAASSRSSSSWQSRNQHQHQSKEEEQHQNQRLSSITSASNSPPPSTSTPHPPPPPPKPRTERENIPKRPLCKPRHPLADPRTACSVRAHGPIGVLADGLSYAAEDGDGEQDQDQDEEYDEFDDEAVAATTATTTTTTTTAFPRKDWSRAMRTFVSLFVQLRLHLLSRFPKQAGKETDGKRVQPKTSTIAPHRRFSWTLRTLLAVLRS
ncbi:hypothetical protein IWX90DRAFT_432277 [Phyllosticta citrichinensis]|uniref:Uncharacterized protein n=1 Tax=Phyllosticta citrichinensis TaxID=1130410 RepID=A0ABR1XT44_9PEZI